MHKPFKVSWRMASPLCAGITLLSTRCTSVPSAINGHSSAHGRSWHCALGELGCSQEFHARYAPVSNQRQYPHHAALLGQRCHQRGEFEILVSCLLAVDIEHAVAVEERPPFRHAPFDRVLSTQAIFEPMRLVTHHPKVAAYSDMIVKR
ncbi:hypothetical protein GTP41_03455 [Pseudoduganella sp. DS3]|uniref:Uncharacterized protein n=1 Tax=Pseudoduganella guangdongensis TaxID=2692179 RepID=A0A6N9HCF6_9BURK|nr:type II toxin-antitoxin system VapC family toxin [Pseudoduganella guangdongensis]MYN01149.1 hypothetical protein [Pseudoduganella guangdongensis]